MKSTAVVVFTRDLRVHDNSALVAASQQNDCVAPLFVLDPMLVNGPQSSANRSIFLYESLTDLDQSLERLGTSLIISQGVWAEEVMKFTATVEATEIHIARDYSRYSSDRARLLEAACEHSNIKYCKRFFNTNRFNWCYVLSKLEASYIRFNNDTSCFLRSKIFG